jgi:hypothetical protein
VVMLRPNVNCRKSNRFDIGPDAEVFYGPDKIPLGSLVNRRQEKKLNYPALSRSGHLPGRTILALVAGVRNGDEYDAPGLHERSQLYYGVQ